MKLASIVTSLVLILAACGGARHADTATQQASPGAHEHEAEKHEHHDQHEHAGQGMDHRFEDPERWSKVFDNPERDVWQKPDEVVSLMRVEPGMTVADIGAGTGYFLGRLSEAVGSEGKVLGLDIEESLVEHMRERAAKSGWENVDARVVSPDDPKLEPGSVDRILIVNTWHHISNRDAYAARLAAALKPGGEVHIIDFTLESERGPGANHKLPPETVIEELEAGGMKASVIEESLPDQYIVVGRTGG